MEIALDFDLVKFAEMNDHWVALLLYPRGGADPLAKAVTMLGKSAC